MEVQVYLNFNKENLGIEIRSVTNPIDLRTSKSIAEKNAVSTLDDGHRWKRTNTRQLFSFAAN